MSLGIISKNCHDVFSLFGILCPSLMAAHAAKLDEIQTGKLSNYASKRSV